MGRSPEEGKESACNVGDWVLSLGWEDPLEKGKATYSSILAWRIPWTVHGVTKRRTRLSDFHFYFPIKAQTLEAVRVQNNYLLSKYLADLHGKM